MSRTRSATRAVVAAAASVRSASLPSTPLSSVDDVPRLLAVVALVIPLLLMSLGVGATTGLLTAPADGGPATAAGPGLDGGVTDEDLDTDGLERELHRAIAADRDAAGVGDGTGSLERDPALTELAGAVATDSAAAANGSDVPPPSDRLDASPAADDGCGVASFWLATDDPAIPAAGQGATAVEETALAELVVDAWTENDDHEAFLRDGAWTAGGAGVALTDQRLYVAFVACPDS